MRSQPWKQQATGQRGRPAWARVVPPPAMASEPGGHRRPPKQSGFVVSVAVDLMVAAFLEASGGRWAKVLAAKRDGAWYGDLRRAAAALVAGGADPAGFVAFVYRTLVAEKGVANPEPQRVFGGRAVEGWLPLYLRRSPQLHEQPTYASSAAWRDEYSRRFLDGRQGPVQLDARVRGGGGPAAGGGPVAPPQDRGLRPGR